LQQDRRRGRPEAKTWKPKNPFVLKPIGNAMQKPRRKVGRGFLGENDKGNVWIGSFWSIF
jgi:hypothetical protein